MNTKHESLTPDKLGFAETLTGWTRTIAGREITFRRVRSRADFEQCERLQRDVFGVGEYDLASFSIMVIIPKTGGEIIGAFDGNHMVGYISGYGGYVGRRPRLVSDLMAVEPTYRGGLGYALKTLQAALALDAGFPEMVWTVDPLRAANARLNFERLGAYACEYVENLYGEDFGQGLYGGMPSDRLVVTWPLESERVRSRLLHGHQPLSPGNVLDIPEYGEPDARCARIAIPTDIDAMLATEPEEARMWRLRLRDQLQRAFADGYAITGFAGQRDAEVGWYVLHTGSSSA